MENYHGRIVNRNHASLLSRSKPKACLEDEKCDENTCTEKNLLGFHRTCYRCNNDSVDDDVACACRRSNNTKQIRPKNKRKPNAVTCERSSESLLDLSPLVFCLVLYFLGLIAETFTLATESARSLTALRCSLVSFAISFTVGSLAK